MIYLIGGTSRSGKSTLAQKLVERDAKITLEKTTGLEIYQMPIARTCRHGSSKKVVALS